jgi:hypothetical protein
MAGSFLPVWPIWLDSIKSILLNNDQTRLAFWAFFISNIPAFFLSTLWAHLPIWLYVFVVIAAFIQVLGWWYFIRTMIPSPFIDLGSVSEMVIVAAHFDFSCLYA